jgi:hypothetical protein
LAEGLTDTLVGAASSTVEVTDTLVTVVAFKEKVSGTLAAAAALTNEWLFGERLLGITGALAKEYP